MFKIAQKRVVQWPVRIAVPVDGGRTATHEAEVEFEHLSRSDFEGLYAAGGSDADLVRRVVRGWAEGQFQDESGQPLPYSPENLARLTEISYVLAAFVQAYLEIQHGRNAARKN